MFDPGGAVRPECSYQGGGVVHQQARDIKSPALPSEGMTGQGWGLEELICTRRGIFYRIRARILTPPIPKVGQIRIRYPTTRLRWFVGRRCAGRW